MCGVFGYVGINHESASLVLRGLKSLEYRGYDSWGVALVPSDRSSNSISRPIEVEKKVGKIGDSRVDRLPPGTIALGHTRWATHGGLTKLNAHPHLDCTGNIAVVHNGIFDNYQELKERLRALGHEFVSETDSEVISHLIEEYLKTQDFPTAVRSAFLKMQGLNAIVVIHADEKCCIAVRNGSPLVIGYGTDNNYIASDPSALLPHTKVVYFMEDHEMAIITASMVVVLDVSTQKEKEVVHQTLDWDSSQTTKEGYSFYMEKEIHQQPDIIAQILDRDSHDHERIAELMRLSRSNYLLGCGSASYAGLAGYYLFSKISNLHVNTAVGSEFSYSLNGLSSADHVIALSQSGETMDLLEILKIAKSNKVPITAIVNVVGSSLHRLADLGLLIGAGPEKSVATTKAFTGKVAHLLLIAYAFAGKIEEGKKVLKQAVKSSEQVLSTESVAKIQALADHLLSAPNIFVFGRGVSYPLSLEVALKIKEISYIHGEGLSTGELKHGTLALIEKNTPCIVFAPDDETYDASMAGVMEIKARGGYVIGVSHKSHSAFDSYIEVADAKEATIIPNAIVGQLLAYYLAVGLKRDPDMPRNLAKSVTVK